MDKDRIETLYVPAAWRALEDFPVEPERVKPVSHSENVTFRVSARNPQAEYVLRLHRPDYNDIRALESERMWTRALKASGIAVPEPLQSLQGSDFTLIDIAGADEQRYAGLTRWIEGTVLREELATGLDRAERVQVFRWIGAMLARLHNQATRWQAPPEFTRRRLDLEGLLGEAPAWGRFWEHPELTATERALLLKKRQELRSVLESYGERPDVFSLIHADVDPGNIIHNGGTLALIDFDDTAYGWHLFDLASTLDEFMYASDFQSLQAALIEGYREHRPLEASDVDMLPQFLLIRGMALIGWYHQRPEHAGSSYFQEVKAWVLGRCGYGARRALK